MKIAAFRCAAATFAALALFAAFGPAVASRAADEPAADRSIGLAEGKLTLDAPKDWVRKQPRTRIVEHEFAVPAGKPDATDGRFTVMAAGGGVEANIARWVDQFSQSDGSSTKEKTKVQKLKVGGQEVHYVDISGDFKDQAGPFAPATLRKDYRLLGAIIVTEKAGQHFLKLTGPKETIGAQEKAFQDMVNSLKMK